MSANVEGSYDSESGKLSVDKMPSESAILVRTRLKAPLKSMALTSGRYLAVTEFIEKLGEEEVENNEFIFVIDCSGSMGGPRIKQARECLELFIRSLPEDSFFNVIRFGSSFTELFPESVLYDESTSGRALRVAAAMEADLGGTNVYAPLEKIYGAPVKGRGAKQLFVLTDGEVSNTDKVIELAREHARSNRCFTIGIGDGADAGLVEGLAQATGGRADFVSAGEDLTGKVIRQLEISLAPSLKGVNIEITGTSGVELAPFPIPSVSQGIAQTVFAAAADPFGSAQVLMSGDFSGTRVDELIDTRETTLGEDVLRALFAFETIRSAQGSLRYNRVLRQKIIALSIASGVLCRETAFVCFSNVVFRKAWGPFDVETSPADHPMWVLAKYAGPRPAPVVCCEAKESPPATPNDMLELIALQSIDGSWRIAEKVQKISGGAVVAAGELEEAVFATALAIAILRKRFSERRAQWAMIEKKAIRWLSRQTQDAEEIIAVLLAQLGV